MDSSKTIEDSPADTKESEGKTEHCQVQKTPVRPGKGVKRKHQSPATPGSKITDEEKPGSAKKRRKSASGTPLSRVGSPGTTPFKLAMTERQQMALLLQLTDPNKQHASGDETPPIFGIDTTPRSRVAKKNERGETPLHIASIKGDVKTATSLINQGAGVNEVDNAGWTPLHEACVYGHTKVVLLLLKHGANVNARGMDGDSPLHDAVANAHLEVVKALLEQGGDPRQANDKGETPIQMCQDSAVMKLLRGSMEVKKGEEKEKEDKMSEIAAKGRETSEGERGEQGEEEEEEGDEDVFETKMETDQVRPSTSKRWKSRSGQKIRKERPTSEEGPLPPKSSSSKKQQKGDFSTKKTPPDEPAATAPRDDDKPSAKEATHTTVDERSGESSLTKLIGKAIPFTSDISSSESDSELPAEGKVATQKEEAEPLLPSQQDEGEDEGAGEGAGEEEREEEEGVEKDGVCVKRERKDDGEKKMSLVKEEGSVKIFHDKEEQYATPGSPPSPATDTGVESLEEPTAVAPEEKGMEDDKQQQQQQASKLNLEPSASMARDSHTSPPSSPETAKSADMTESESVHDDTIPAEEQSKGQTSPVVTSPRAKPRLPSAESAETTFAKWAKDNYVVSIPLSLVRLSRKSKSRSSSKDLGDLYSQAEMKMDTSEGREEQQLGGSSKEMHVHVPSMLLTRSESRSDIVDHIRSSSRAERRDSTSSQDSRSSASGERKHSRKPQHVYSSKKLFKDIKREDERGRGEGEDVSDSFSISVEFGVLPAQQSKLMRQGSVSSPTSLTVASSSPGLSVQSQGKRTVEDSALVLLNAQGPPLSSSHAVSYDENKSDSGDDSKSTVISFPTSLPIQFSGQSSLSTSQSRSKDLLATPPTFKMRSLPSVMETVKSSASAPVTPMKREKSGSHQESTIKAEQDILSLPPKKRFRAVQRSSVIQQLRSRQAPPPTLPAHYNSFLMFTGQYRSNQHLQPTNPKSVYPPLHSSMYKLFTEQESERVRLATAHLAEQDRIVLSMEQELLRAHQRASKCHAPINVCSVLLEQLLPKGIYEIAGESPTHYQRGVQTNETSLSVKNRESGVASDALDVRLLAGLIQDVWDKFFQLKESVQIRQRHETEALWLVQRELWKQRQSELGFMSCGSPLDVPSAHVPQAALYLLQADSTS